MGMFDYIRCEHPLPAPNAEGLQFQTKDVCLDLDALMIKRDGTLWRIQAEHSDNEIGHLSDYFGELRFHKFFQNTGGAWLEFRARFVDGKLHGPIVLIEDTRAGQGERDAC